jgi:hypothetical protein
MSCRYSTPVLSFCVFAFSFELLLKHILFLLMPVSGPCTTLGSQYISSFFSSYYTHNMRRRSVSREEREESNPMGSCHRKGACTKMRQRNMTSKATRHVLDEHPIFAFRNWDVCMADTPREDVLGRIRRKQHQQTVVKEDKVATQLWVKAAHVHD